MIIIASFDDDDEYLLMGHDTDDNWLCAVASSSPSVIMEMLVLYNVVSRRRSKIGRPSIEVDGDYTVGSFFHLQTLYKSVFVLGNGGGRRHATSKINLDAKNNLDATWTHPRRNSYSSEISQLAKSQNV